jgi:heat shock protein HtpX
MPKVYIIPTDAPNAFATGRSPAHASVAATAGILESLSEDELEGVMAHELAHVRNRDTLTSTVAATLAGAITWIASMARWGAVFGGGSRDDDRGGLVGTMVMAIVAPLAALLLQMALSRSREYAADEAGARMCGKPLALAGALARLEASAKSRPLTGGNPATASLFIVNPFRGGMLSLFSTHPPMEKRIEKLRELARQLP